MNYNKPALTYEQQADQLLARGLGADRQALIQRLQSVSYYRLSGYWFPFKNPNDDTFAPGTTLQSVWNRYVFDRQLRLLALDAIERLEVAVRTDLIYLHAHQFGPFGYLDATNLPNLSPEKFQGLQKKIDEAYGENRERFIRHFKDKYGDQHSKPPLWMMTELMTFGMLLTFFRGIPKPMKAQIAARYGVADVVFESWLRAMNSIRNVCAHHGRLWNRILGDKPMIPSGTKHRDWQQPVLIAGDRVFGMLSILRFGMLKVAPHSSWKARLERLFAGYPDVPLMDMGFPDNWRDSPIWS